MQKNARACIEQQHDYVSIPSISSPAFRTYTKQKSNLLADESTQYLYFNKIQKLNRFAVITLKKILSEFFLSLVNVAKKIFSLSNITGWGVGRWQPVKDYPP